MERVMIRRFKRFNEGSVNLASKNDLMEIMDALDLADSESDSKSCAKLADKFERLYSNTDDWIEVSSIRKDLIRAKKLIDGMKERAIFVSKKLDNAINKFELEKIE